MIETSVLPCGIRLVTETMADVRSVAVAYWVGTGSRDEPGELAGASHFLEHLLFKGTERRSAAAIAEELDEVGGDCNAFTTKEYTTFYVRLLSEHLSLGLDILSDIMWAPALRPDDVEAERTVILDEILMHADEPADLAGERWQAALFPDHPLGTDTLGTAVIGAAHQPRRHPRLLRPALPTVQHGRLGGGRLHPRGGGGRSRSSASPGTTAANPGPAAGRPRARTTVALDVVRRSTEQAHLVYGMRSVSRFDERRWALSVLNHVLGGGLSSRLFQKVREQRGLAYSVWSERAAYQDSGSLAVVVGTATEHVDEVLEIVDNEFELLAADGVTDRELAVAKGNLRAEMLLSNEDSGARMSRLGASMLLHGEVLTVDEVLARIDGIGKADVLAVAAELAQAPRTLTAVGPFDEHHFESHRPALAAR